MSSASAGKVRRDETNSSAVDVSDRLHRGTVKDTYR
jgi:hypothetical protein